MKRYALSLVLLALCVSAGIFIPNQGVTAAARVVSSTDKSLPAPLPSPLPAPAQSTTAQPSSAPLPAPATASSDKPLPAPLPAPATSASAGKPLPAPLPAPASGTAAPAAAVAASDLPAAVVVWVNGTIRAVAPKVGPRVLQRRSPVYLHDTIITDHNSTGEIVFSDQTVMALRGDTVLRIDQYKYNPAQPNSKDVHQVMTLIKGGFRTVTGIIAKTVPDNYQVNTPVATIGVRGTAYAVFYNGQLFIEYTSGEPCVSNSSGSFCMSIKMPYGKVFSDSQAPEPKYQKPNELNDIPTMTSATFSINTSGVIGGPGLGAPVATPQEAGVSGPNVGGSSSTVVAPTVMPLNAPGVGPGTPGNSKSSFCIQ